MHHVILRWNQLGAAKVIANWKVQMRAGIASREEQVKAEAALNASKNEGGHTCPVILRP